MPRPVCCFIIAPHNTSSEGLVANNSTDMTCEYFDIIDGEDYCVPYEFIAKGVGLKRVLASKDGWYSVCLPYKTDVPSGVKAYELQERNHEKVTFKRVKDQLMPFVPYIFVAQEDNAAIGTDIDQVMPVSSTVAGQSVETLGYKLTGTLKKISNSDAADMQAYILQSDHKYHLVKKTNTKAYIPAYRHFFQLSDNTQNMGEFGFDMVDDEDGIQYIEMLEEDGTATYYDLSGRKLPGKPNRGVYIKNNQKFYTK